MYSVNINSNSLTIKNKNISFCYLYVPGCKGIGGYNGIQKFNFSINSLKKYCNYKNIYLYCGNDGTDMGEIPKMKKYCNENDIIFIDVGIIKHDFGRINKSINIKNPYRLNILIEKLYILLNHNENEDIVLVDIDIQFKQKIPEHYFGPDNAILAEKESNHILKIRNLKEAFKLMNIEIDNNTPYYNSGIIYIPQKKRVKIAKEAINMVVYMNKHDDKYRCGKDLDEQISIGSIIYKYYKSNIFTVNKYIKHYWGETMNNIPYWIKYNIGIILSKNNYNILDKLIKIKENDNFNHDPANLINGEIYSIAVWILALKETKLKYKLIDMSNCNYLGLVNQCNNILFYFTYSDELYNKLKRNDDYTKYYNYSYFEQKNIKKDKDINILTTYYNNKYNIALGIYPIPINKNNINLNIDKNIKGLIWSKCVSHWVDHNKMVYIKNFINLTKKLNIKLFTTLRNIKNMSFPSYLKEENRIKYYNTYDNITSNFNNIINLKQTTITNFRSILENVKFVVGFGVPGSGPTIVECLHSKTILFCPSEQVPVDLFENKNIILTDKLTEQELCIKISDVISNKIKFDNTNILYNYTFDGVKNRLYNIFSNITENMIVTLKQKDIGICYLSWKSNETLKKTLESHKKNNLFKIINDKHIFFQEISNTNINIANKYLINYDGSDINHGIFYGFKKLVEKCKNKYIIFCEDDFKLYYDFKHCYNILEDAILLFENNNADIIRLRDMVNPGKPLYSKGYTNSLKFSNDLYNKNKYGKQFKHILESLNWLQNPENVFNELKVVDKKFKWYHINQSKINWSNNIFIAKRECLLNIIIPLFNNIQINYFKKNIHLNMELYLDNLDIYMINNDNNIKLKNLYNNLNIYTTHNSLFTHERN